ncbi:small multi-drug export protein [Candidatus Woesearchaeota archaeon]|jgi:uncharacterized membrane protein|nr:small multi-drug export protein [Candidatus Woesearchaeota archaeon]MBT5272807.1 small multi-drug export protein [Candidatus Woesearchaeota archaeon]MBT6040419.1 small multi-drug export protein [Candidatus Woesearchaeota archaeon]MBT6336948.1 small multi-drug export protein [Candidatus Woesearchaeota archaeon]MBT7926834.1 small multi-drug export protein [Candidatus Woesearchaeota archaeon]
MLKEILELIGVTLLPGLELRASIPFGILQTELHWFSVFIICVIVNILLGIVVYFLLDKVVHLFFFWEWFHRIYHKIVERAQKKVHKYVEKYGTIGLGLFIGIPLPGSGVYTGALGAYVLGFGYKRFIIASTIGVLIAGIIVTAIMLTGSELFHFLVKT